MVVLALSLATHTTGRAQGADSLGTDPPSLAAGGMFNPGQNMGGQTPTAATFLPAPVAGVGTYTGAVQLSIPLFSAPMIKGELPVSLDYSGTAIRPAEVAGWVGQGWRINVGGVITRVVRGLPDDSEFGYSRTGGRLTDELVGELSTASPYGQMWESGDPRRVLVQDLIDGRVDPHPDEFHYSFPGGGGRFLWLPDDQQGGPSTGSFVWTVPHSMVRIEPEARTSISMGPLLGQIEGVPSWTITDTDGRRYTYGEVEVAQHPPTFSQSANAGRYVASWYLTQIHSAEGALLAQFTYTSPASPYDIVEEEHLPTNTYRELVQGTIGGGCLEGNRSATYASYELHVVKFLSRIETEAYQVDFERGLRDDGRRDASWPDASQQEFSQYVDGERQRMRLERIVFRSNTNGGSSAEIRTFEFTYEDSVPRLLLSRIEEYGGGVGIPSYEFSYFDTNQMPSDRLTKSIDYWGFYNGKGNIGSSLIPDVELTGQQVPGGFSYDGIDRSPGDLAKVRAGLLHTIVYPTGGETVVEYERAEYGYAVDLQQSNGVIPIIGGSQIGGGIRVRSIASYDRPRSDPDAIELRRTFEYTMSDDPNKSSGVLTRPPVFWHVVNINVNSCSCSSVYSAVYLQSSPLPGLSAAPPVMYHAVTELVDGAGSTLREYAVPLPNGVGTTPNPAQVDFYARGVALRHPNDLSYTRGYPLREVSFEEGASGSTPIRESVTTYRGFVPGEAGSLRLNGMNFLSGGPEAAVCDPDVGSGGNPPPIALSPETFGYSGNVADYPVGTAIYLPDEVTTKVWK